MPYVNGVYRRLQSWVARQAAGAAISAVEFDADGNDVAAALSDCLLRDGTSVPLVDMPWGGKGITGLRAGAAPGEAATYDQMTAAIQAGQTSTNRLHNSSFVVNQRGVSGTVNLAAGVYGHDRWKAGASGCTYTFAANGPDVAITITAGSLLQVVHPADIQGGAYVLSQDSAGTASARVYQGSPSGSFSACPVSTTGLTAATATVVEFGPGTIIRPQLIQGATAQAYNRKSITSEIENCICFFEIINASITVTNPYTNGASFNASITFHPKVAVPTVNMSGSGSIIGIFNNSISINLTIPAQSNGYVTGAIKISADL